MLIPPYLIGISTMLMPLYLIGISTMLIPPYLIGISTMLIPPYLIGISTMLIPPYLIGISTMPIPPYLIGIRFKFEALVIRIKSCILNFCGIRKSRFQCCTGQFWSNQVVIVVKRIRNISFKIVETFVLIPSINASNRRV